MAKAETFEQMAVRVAKEIGSVVGGHDGTDTQCWTGDIAFDENGLREFAHAIHEYAQSWWVFPVSVIVPA